MQCLYKCILAVTRQINVDQIDYSDRNPIQTLGHSLHMRQLSVFYTSSNKLNYQLK